jgi:hypothetical protein
MLLHRRHDIACSDLDFCLGFDKLLHSRHDIACSNLDLCLGFDKLLHSRHNIAYSNVYLCLGFGKLFHSRHDIACSDLGQIHGSMSTHFKYSLSLIELPDPIESNRIVPKWKTPRYTKHTSKTFMSLLTTCCLCHCFNVCPVNSSHIM